MSLLTICQGLAKNVGMEIPDVVVTSPDRSWAEALEFANEVGEELVRRFDWPLLFEEEPLIGTGTNSFYTLPDDFSRLPSGIAVRYQGAPVRSLTRGEIVTLTQYEGAPRYFWLSGNRLQFWPYPAFNDQIDLHYISKNWCDSGPAFLSDEDETIFDEDLFTLGLIVRWRRQKGMPYSDEEAEYESALQDFANFSGAARF